MNESLRCSLLREGCLRTVPIRNIEAVPVEQVAMQVLPVQPQVALSGALVVMAIALVILTIVLIYMTRTYAQRATEQTATLDSVTEALDRSRTDRYRPVLKGAIVLTGESQFDFAIVNTGQSAAHDVEAEWSIDDFPHTSTWTASYIAPGERHRFELRLGDEQGAIRTQTTDDRPIDSAQAVTQYLEETPGVLTYEASCENPLGTAYEFTGDIPLKELVAERTDHAIEVVE